MTREASHTHTPTQARTSTSDTTDQRADPPTATQSYPCNNYDGCVVAAPQSAMRALKAERTEASVEVFRSAAMLQRRGHFTPGLAAKQSTQTS